MAKKEKDLENSPLEKVVERLEAIVEELESGDADLEKSINLFREGKRLGDLALKRLDALEQRIQVVVQEEDGKLEVDDFEAENQQ